MMALGDPIAKNKASLVASKIFLIFLIVLYFILCFTPLRLHYDSIRYFAIKDCLELGCPPDSDAAKDFFPFGYTALLLLYSKLGILHSFSIVFTNALYLFGGLLFLYKVFDKSISPISLFVLVLCNWLFIKFVTHPLSEMQYLFLSMACVYYFHQYTQTRKLLFLLLAIFLSWLALQTRTIGISLVAGIGVGLVWEYKNSMMLFLKKNKLLVGAAVILIVAAVILFARQLGLYHYFNVFTTHLKETSFLTRLGWHFTEWGEVFLNMPSGKAIEKLPSTIGSSLFVIVGVLLFAWFSFSFFRSKAIPFYLKAYIFFYCIILFNWPFADPRFWVPILPVMVVTVLQAPLERFNWTKIAGRLVALVYIVMGMLSAGFMLYSSFNKSFFAKTQANGVYQKEYEMHFFGKVSIDTATSTRHADTTYIVNPAIVDLLKRHD